MLLYDAIFGVAWVLFLGYIIKIFLEYRMQKLIIQNGLVNEKLEHLFKKPVQPGNLSSIKWGMVMIGIGLGFLAKQFWPNQFYDEGLTGIILLLGGFGFVLYYFIAKRIEGK